MTTEREWVETLVQRLDKQLRQRRSKGSQIQARAHFELTYAHEILSYSFDNKGRSIPDLGGHSPTYQTDILISEHRADGTWTPRVIIECKIGDSKISTHDALTYSAKAATHKHVHPYLRYGILLGAFNNSLPYRLVRHGSYFDFMVALKSERPSPQEWDALLALLKDEIKASRMLQDILTNHNKQGRERFSILHKPLCLVPYVG